MNVVQGKEFTKDFRNVFESLNSVERSVVYSRVIRVLENGLEPEMIISTADEGNDIQHLSNNRWIVSYSYDSKSYQIKLKIVDDSHIIFEDLEVK